MKKISIYLSLIGTLLVAPSCKDYLEEDLVSTVSYSYYNTERGMEDLINASYSSLRWTFNGEQSFTMNNYGVDEYMNAADGQFKFWNTYGPELNPSTAAGYIHDMWTEYYSAINRCNLAIQGIPNITGTGVLKDDAGKNLRIAELRFLRAFYYFKLVQQFGAIPLVLEGSTNIRLEFNRSPVPEVYKLIIKDLREAEAILPATQSQMGRATKGAARHFLASAYLTRGSAVTEQRGQKPTDMDSAAYYADLVLTSGQYALQNNYADLWNIQNQDRIQQAGNEVIFAAQFNTNALLLNGAGNRVHLYYQMTYDVIPGMVRDIANGRPFRRLMPTDYALDIFDRKNDSRFYKSFKLTYFSNGGTPPTWTAATAPNPSLVGRPKFRVGDTAVYVTLHNNVSDAAVARRPYTWIPRNKYTEQNFPTLLKFLDPLRADITTEFGTRDGILARLGETYLIGAEAHGRKGNYTKALEYINKLRERAAYKAGEAKPQEYWFTEGGTKGDLNSTYNEITVTETQFENNVPAEKYPPSATTKQARFIHFILNERTRELLGELYRWNDLQRTETLVERVKLFNPKAQRIEEKHKLRPIPQDHIDRLWKNGAPLAETDKAAEQNPGY